MKSVLFALTFILSTYAFAADYTLDQKSIKLNALIHNESDKIDTEFTVKRTADTPRKVKLTFAANQFETYCVETGADYRHQCVKEERVRYGVTRKMVLDFKKAAKLEKGESEVFLLKIKQNSDFAIFNFKGEAVESAHDYEIKKRPFLLRGLRFIAQD